MMKRDRSRNGPRKEGRDYHYALCNGEECPCFREGVEEGMGDAKKVEGEITPPPLTIKPLEF